MVQTASPSERIVTEVSPNDAMFHGCEDHYLGVGRSAIQCIVQSLRAARIPTDQVKRILDLPCGHGRVLRHLRATFPDAQVTGCDLLDDGVDFCASMLGAVPVYSDEDPGKIPLESDAFDLIWVGSLLTHLDADHWISFLKLFSRCLRPGGVLVFTTHGRDAYQGMIESRYDYGIHGEEQAAVRARHERTGFAFARYPTGGPCGTSFSKPTWVLSLVPLVTDMRLVMFSESLWVDHHDVYAFVKNDPA